MGFWIFLVVLLITILCVAIMGRREERFIMATLTANYVATALIYRLGAADWLQPQLPILLLECLTLGLIGYIAMRSERYWPLGVAGIQILPVLGMLVIWIGQDLASNAVGFLQTIWSYPQLAILIIASFRNKSREAL